MLQTNCYQSYFADIGGTLELPKRPILALPSPQSFMHTRLKQLENEAIKEAKKLANIKRIWHEQCIKARDAKFAFERFDHQVALVDGRLIVERPNYVKKPTRKINPVLTCSPKEEVEQALKLMSAEDKEELIRNLLN